MFQIKKKFVTNLVDMPPMFHKVFSGSPKEIEISHLVRMKCHNCGAYKRKRDCPPFVPSVDDCRERFLKYDLVFVFIWKSDGSIPWRKGFDENKLVEKIGRGLKGTAIGMQVAIQNKMFEIRKAFKKKYSKNSKVKIWIAGPCHKCRVCNIFGKCTKGFSAPSMEAWGIDIFSLFDKLRVEYEHPVMNYITCCSLIAIKLGDARFKIDEE